MTEQAAAALKEAADAAGIDVRFSDTYSGRGQMGARTNSMDGSIGEMIAVIALAAGDLRNLEDSDSEFEEFVEEMRGLSMDQMGRDVVLY